MKYKWYILLLVAVLITAVVFFLNSSENPAKNELSAVNDLPLLSITKVDGGMVNLHDVQGKAVLIFFNPDCDHCQNEAKQISGQKHIFKDYAVYFVSADAMPNIGRFAEEYKLIEPNFYFSQAEGIEVFNTMGSLPSIPAIFIYNNKRLVKKFEGEVKLEDLMKFL